MTEHHHHPAYVAHHFESSQQQFDAGKLGIWIFLVTEILFFGGLFCAYAVYRASHPEIFAFAHQRLDVTLGAVNTAVLLFSSLTMALAVRAAQTDNKKHLVLFLVLTILCAFGFLGIKSVEYAHKFHEGLFWGKAYAPAAELTVGQPPNTHIFFSIYFMMTGLHGIHVVIGIGILIWILIRAIRGEFHHDYFGPVDYTGLYWHLVDLIWIYLFPLLYLIH